MTQRWRILSGAGRRAVALAVILVMTAGVAGSTATQSATFRTAVDLSRGVHFNVIANPTHPLFGRFAFGQVGAGVFWASGATLTKNPDGSVDVTYVGTGLRDSAATVDVYLGLHRYSGSEASVPLDLSIHLDAADGSGTGRLIADGVTYSVDPVVQPPSAAPEAQAVLALIEASDWSGLYTQLLPATQQAMTEAEFVAAMNQGISQNGSIVDVRATGVVAEYDQGAWHAAAQPFEIDLDTGGQITTRTSRLALLFAGGQWRVYSIDQLAAPPPDTTPPTSGAGPLDAAYESATVDIPYTASDLGSGVDHVELWSRYGPSGSDPWGAWTLGPTGTSSPITYTFGADGFYEFYTIAVDGAGNREQAPAIADAATEKVPASTWTPSIRVNDDTGTTDQTKPAIAIGSDGTAHAVWRDTRSGNSDIYYARRDPATGAWSANERVNDVTTGEQFEPSVAVDDAGNVYAIWTDQRVSDDRNIYFSKRSAATGTWSASVRVNDDPTSKKPEQRMPAIAVSGGGMAVAAWRDFGPTRSTSTVPASRSAARPGRRTCRSRRCHPANVCPTSRSVPTGRPTRSGTSPRPAMPTSGSRASLRDPRLGRRTPRSATIREWRSRLTRRSVSMGRAASLPSGRTGGRIRSSCERDTAQPAAHGPRA